MHPSDLKWRTAVKRSETGSHFVSKNPLAVSHWETALARIRGTAERVARRGEELLAYVVMLSDTGGTALLPCLHVFVVMTSCLQSTLVHSILVTGNL